MLERILGGDGHYKIVVKYQDDNGRDLPESHQNSAHYVHISQTGVDSRFRMLCESDEPMPRGGL